MSNTKHTPGPWHVDGFTKDKRGLNITGGGDTGQPWVSVAVLHPENNCNYHYAGDDSALQANARLIAAAPDLLAALRWLVDDLTDAGEDRNPETGEEYDSVTSARDALAKATGKEAA